MKDESERAVFILHPSSFILWEGGPMTDVLIVNPPSPDGHVYIRDMCRWGRKSREKMVWPQTSLAYLAAMVPEGMSVRIIDAIAEEMSLETFLAEIRKEKPRFYVSYI